ncbi:catalase [Sphingomonas sp. H160509]|uniref:catalase n=1 Tax=Sphingomonas sp. H160509 TaxID=2955313 RepID=UPI00237CF549|nr:catalase [Sphingomonas sp. H160509]
MRSLPPSTVSLGITPGGEALPDDAGRSPASWGTTSYFGVNSFALTDASQHSHFVRYRFVPEAGNHYLTAADVAKRSPDYLAGEIVERVARGPIRFGWYAQMAAAVDVIEDPSIAWPESRRLVKLGVVTIDRVGPQTALADKSLAFLPGSTPAGIAIADPMLTIRNAAYPLSFHERQ